MRAKALVVIMATLVSIFLLEPTLGATGINRGIFWTDTNMRAYETGIIFRTTSASTNGTQGAASGPVAPFSNSGGATETPCTVTDLISLCSPTKENLSFINVLGPCSTNPTSPCIESVAMRNASEEWVKGKYEGERIPAWKQYAWSNDYLRDMDRARASNIYSFEGVRHGRGLLFEINPFIEGKLTKEVITYSRLRIDSRSIFQETINSESQGKRCLIDYNIFLPKAGDTCWLTSNLQENWELSVSILLPASPNGWATGRLFDAEIKIEKSSSTLLPSRLTVSGKPTLVPELERSFLKDISVDFEEWNKVAGIFGLPWDEISRGPQLGPSNLAQFVALVKSLPSFDKATGEHNSWAIDFTFAGTLDQAISKCNSKEVVGYAGSNSLTFENAIPKYDLTSSTLVYTVASPHFRSDGSEALGQYQLLLDYELALCLWNLSDNPTKAEIVVTDSTGNSKLVTTSMNRVGQYLRFTAAGFSFSQAKIAVRIPATMKGEEKTTTPSTTTQEISETKESTKVGPKVLRYKNQKAGGACASKLAGSWVKTPTGVTLVCKKQGSKFLWKKQ